MGSHFKDRIRTKKFLVWVIITPILIIGFLNIIAGPSETEEQMEVSMVVVDADEGSKGTDFVVPLLESEDKLDIQEVKNLKRGIEMLRKGEVDLVMYIPDDFSETLNQVKEGEEDYESVTIEFYHTREDQEEIIETLLKGINADINEKILGGDLETPVKMSSRSIPAEERDWVYSDLLLPGGIVIVMLQSGFFASSDNASVLIESMMDKRLGISPVPKIYSISGMVMMDALFTMVAGLIAVLVGLVLFEVSLPLVHFIGMIPIIFISSLVFSYIGCCLGEISSDRVSSQGLSSMMLFPLYFFSQAYLFSAMFPEHVITISKWLPIYPATDMMKQLLFYSPSLSYYGIKVAQAFLWLIPVFILFVYFYRE